MPMGINGDIKMIDSMKKPRFHYWQRKSIASNQEKEYLCLNQKKIAQYSLNGELIRIFYGTREIKDELGLNRPSIINCCNKKGKTAYGYKWEYIDDIFSENCSLRKEMRTNN